MNEEITQITSSVDKQIMGTESNHIASTNFLIVPSNFFVPLPLFFSQIPCCHNKKRNVMKHQIQKITKISKIQRKIDFWKFTLSIYKCVCIELNK